MFVTVTTSQIHVGIETHEHRVFPQWSSKEEPSIIARDINLQIEYDIDRHWRKLSVKQLKS